MRQRFPLSQASDPFECLAQSLMGAGPTPAQGWPAAPAWSARDGNFVLKDPGQVRFAVDIDYNGTPGDPSDDIEVPGSFRIVRSSTGNSDFSNRDSCADLVEFTS
jgi:hypothetical protein